MRKSRKGFTLVELLIVIAILATLTATMMVSLRGATAKAKAAAIAANLESCHTAALLYYAASGDKDIADVEAEDMLKVNLKVWDKLKGTATSGTTPGDAIVYTATGKGPDGWTVNVDFTKDSECDDIAKALKNMRGYSSVEIPTTAFLGSDALDPIIGFFGATPAYAEGGDEEQQQEQQTQGTSNVGKIKMNLMTGEITAGNDTESES